MRTIFLTNIPINTIEDRTKQKSSCLYLSSLLISSRSSSVIVYCLKISNKENTVKVKSKRPEMRLMGLFEGTGITFIIDHIVTK